MGEWADYAMAKMSSKKLPRDYYTEPWQTRTKNDVNLVASSFLMIVQEKLESKDYAID